MATAVGFQRQIPPNVIHLAQSGDMSAIEKIYRTYADASYSLALRICDNRELAQDIVHEAFIKIINRIKSYRSEGSFAGWVRKIVVHETINRIKAESRLLLIADEDALEIESNNLFDSEWVIACQDISTLLSQLNENYRAVFLLHELEGYNHREIAKFYQKSESFSKITLSRAYSKLKKIVLMQEQKSAFK